MKEAAQPRFAVDLEEIERQLSQAQTAQAQPAANRNDPLAELARIVGQDDPFQSLLGDKPQQHDPSGLDDLFVSRERIVQPLRPAAGDYGLRGAVEPQAAQRTHASYSDNSEPAAPYREPAAPYAEPAQSYGYQPLSPQHPGAYADEHAAPGYQGEAYDQGYYDEKDDAGALSYVPQAPEERGYAKAPKRKGRLALLAAVGAVAVGGAGAYVYMSGHSVLSGEPPLIAAKTEPVKIQPQSPGGVEIPNQNKQIYERASSDTQTKVVNREEQPVDIRQTMRVQGNGDAAGAAGPRPNAGGLNLGEPRKVRTIAIRPDGSIIGSEPPGQAGLQPPSTASVPAPSAPPAPPAAQPVPGSSSALPASQGRQVAATTPVPTTKVMTVPIIPAAPPQNAAVVEPAPQRVASAAPTAIAAAPAPAAPAAVATGDFAVQLGVSQSEADARAILQRLQQKYADLSGQPPLIRKAEVNGKSFYRVRVGPMSSDDASSLCSKLRGQGADCYVARN
jgi:hypothetical protein